MFISTFLGSLAKVLPNPIFSIRIEMLIYLILSLAIALITICYFGLIRDKLMYLELGLFYLVLIVYGNLFNVFKNNINTPIFYVIIFVLTILVLGVVEYTLKNRNELRTELLEGINKG